MFSSWTRTIIAPPLMRKSFTTLSTPKFIQFTDNLCAEPLKKKKRLDPAIIKQREERRRKRLEKQIKRLEKNSLQMKRIVECEIPLEILNSAKLYNRIIASSDQLDHRILAFKEWTCLNNLQYQKDKSMIERIMESYKIARECLKMESPKLYRAAIEHEADFIPWKALGPVETSPIQGYDSPDGEYIDISKKWDNIS